MKIMQRHKMYNDLHVINLKCYFVFLDELFFQRRTKIKNYIHGLYLIDQCFDKISTKVLIYKLIIEIFFETIFHIFLGGEFIKHSLDWSLEKIYKWLYRNRFNVHIQKSFLNNISKKIFVGFTKYALMQLLFCNQKKSIKSYCINDRVLNNDINNDGKNLIKKRKLHVQKYIILIFYHNSDSNSLIILSQVKFDDIVQNSSLRNINIYEINNFKSNQLDNSYKTLMSYNYPNRISEKYYIISFYFNKKNTYNFEYLLRFSTPRYSSFELSNLNILKETNNNSKEVAFLFKLFSIQKSNRSQNYNSFNETLFYKNQNLDIRKKFFLKNEKSNITFSVNKKFSSFFQKINFCINFSSFIFFKNALKYPKFKNIEFGIFSNDIILQSISILLDIFKLKIKFRNIFNILTKEYINNLWISEIFGKENRKYALKLIKIIQSTKNKEALIIVDLTKCMNSIDIKKELYKKPNMIELWSKCHIFIIQIHIKYYDEKLNYKRLIYVKLYANNFETLQFYIESFLKKNIKLSFNIILVYSISYNKLLMSKNTYLDLLPDLILLDSNNIHFQTSNNFFRTIANISNEKVNMKFNNAQVLFVSASKYNNSDSVVYMEDLNYKSQIKRNVHREKIQFQESNILDNLNNQNKKDFDIFQNNRVNISFPNKIIENVTNYKVFFLLNRDKKLLKYSNFSNTRFFNNEKHTNIKKSISFLKKGTTSTCFLIIFREIFVNFKNEFFENLNILNLNKCSKKSYKKAKNRLKKHEKSYSFFKDNHKSKIAVYDFKNNSFFSSGLSNLCFSVYDENIHGLLLSRKKSNIMTLSSKNSFTKNSLLTDMIFFTKNMFQTFKLSKDIYYETYEIKYSNDGYKLDQLLKKLLNSRLSNSQDSFCQNQTIFNRKAFYNTENKSHFEEISSLSNNNSDFIDEIENEQKMFWAIKPKKIVNRTCSERLNSNIDYFLDHNLGQKVSLNNTKVTNSINTSTGNIFSNEFFKSLFSISGNIENDHNSTLKHSISAKNIFEVPFSSNEWKLFPLIHIIYENLNFFFQNHDLNNPVIGQLFGLVNFSDIDYVLDVFLIFLGIISPIYYTNIRKCIKSIKTAAKKTVEVQKEYKNIFENNEQFILKSTELWEAKFQEMKLNKNNLSLVEINNMEKTPIFKWIKGKLIGKGRYGKVYLAMNVITGETLAVKQVKIYNNLNDADYEYQKILINALNIEIETMKDLDHPNIVQYLGYEKTKTTISIFLEYVSGGSIGRCLRKYGKIDQQTIQLFTRQILEGLTYLHSQGILHRDLKTDNILLDINGICKISDFGISKKSDDIYNDNVNMSMQGTIFWMAPEVIQNRKQGYSAKIDIWSLGCLVLEMFAGRRPWSDDEAIGAMFKLGNKSQPPPIPEDILTSINDDALDFLKSCFIINPDIRPTAQALLKHPFIEKSDPMFKFSDSMLSRLIRTE